MNKDLLVEKKISIKAGSEKVWEALTNPEKIKLYFYGTEVETSWIVGDPIIFKGDFDGKSFQDKGNIIESIPGKTLQYDYWSSWSGLEDKAENYSLVSYSLEQSDGHTQLVLTQQGFSSEMNLEHAKNSWDYILSEMKNLIEENS